MSDEATQTALRQMAHEIGALGATVKNLTDSWRAQDEKASNGRAILHTKIDGLGLRFANVESGLAAVKKDVDEMKPIIEQVKTAKERAIGVIWSSRILYAVGIALTAGTTFVFSNWVKISIR